MASPPSTAKDRVPRVRFAPSPTGYLHVGGARTTLFNWLFARHFSGRMILRIEDTDLERSTPEMVEGILTGLTWLGLDWDEGPYYQSERTDLYRRAAERLLDSAHAYLCFCTKEQLEERRQKAAQEGRPPIDGTCRRLDPEEAGARRSRGEPAALRFRVPDSGKTGFDDRVFGRVEFENSELEDFVLLRSDGSPTYHLSVVEDDRELGITHVIRGADHISNTPKQLLLYQALGAPLPEFAHLPLILGPDKTRLSKRHGATSVLAYREQGILPDAFRNFLALLGWTPPAGTPELLADRELIRLFSLAAVSRSNAIFDRAKLDWFNSEYIRSYPAERLLAAIAEEWATAGLTVEREHDYLLRAVELVKPRARKLKDFAESFRAFFVDDFEADPQAVERFLSDEALAGWLAELARRYQGLEDFGEAASEQALRDFAAEKGVKAGALINGARVALTGQAVAPSLFAVMAVLGKKRVIDRLGSVDRLIERARATRH